jgi:hypothetical protein
MQAVNEKETYLEALMKAKTQQAEVLDEANRLTE